jgi:hypothetical protein
MNKQQLLDLLDEVQYAEFFSGLDKNGVKHPQLLVTAEKSKLLFLCY